MASGSHEDPKPGLLHPTQQLLLEPSCLERDSEHGKPASSQQSHYPTNICQVPTTCYMYQPIFIFTLWVRN